MEYERLFLSSLILTIVVESIVVLVLARYLYNKRNYADIVIASIIASTLTLPYFWFILPNYIHQRLPYVITGELIIILIEAVIYWRLLKLEPKHALIISFLANCTSILVGILVNQLILKYCYQQLKRFQHPATAPALTTCQF